MKVEAIRYVTEQFDGERYVDMFLHGRSDALGLGKIKLCNVTYDLDAHSNEQAVIITSADGLCTFHIDPRAIDGFALVSVPEKE